MSEEYKCDICGAPATVHLTQIVDGKIHKVHLCEKCAAKSKVAELPILKFTEMLAKTLAAGGKKAAQEIASTESAGRAPAKVCPLCGMTDVVFEKKRLIGCPHCYEVFSEEIDALLPEIQPGHDYRGDAAKSAVPAGKPDGGKKPGEGAPSGSEAGVPVSLDALRRRLQSAVAAEDYALAARLRDEIRRAEKPAETVPAETEKSKSAKKPGARRSRPRKKSSEGGKA